MDISSSFNIVLWSYTGCDSLGQVLEDLSDLNKNLNRVLLGGVFLTSATVCMQAIFVLIHAVSDFCCWFVRR